MRWLLALAVVTAACGAPAVLASPTPAASPLPVAELKYRVFEQVGRPWFCDPDFFPVARADELELARQRLPDMERDAESFPAILRHHGITPGSAYSLSDALLLDMYRDWKDLQRLVLEPAGSGYRFSELVRPAAGGKQSEKVDGQVDPGGRVSVSGRTPGGFLNCPICLSAGTFIDTPRGPVAVTDLGVGDVVWTLDASGHRVGAPVVATGSVEAPTGHAVLRVTLSDGRTVTASPGHPTSDGRALGGLAVGDRLDGSAVVAIERLPYRGRTYDLLPAGPTGAYWADGVLLGSTLRR